MMKTWAVTLLLAAGVLQAGTAVAKPAPQGPHELCRTLERSLADGATLVVERCWMVRFAPTEAGVLVEGEQSSVAVEAPEALAALAGLEEQRVESGIFPLILDRDGLIIDDGSRMTGQSLAEAGNTAAAIIASIDADAQTAEAMQDFVRQVSQASTEFLGRLPRDLFFPQGDEHSETIEVALPDGLSGQVTIARRAQTRAPSGLIVAAERSIRSRAGQTERVSLEKWTLRATAS